MGTAAQLILFLACVTTAWAQAGLPKCAESCFEEAAAAVKCPISDISCLCTASDLDNLTLNCIDANRPCSPIQYLKLVAVLDSFCDGTTTTSSSKTSSSETSTSQSSTTTSHTSITSTTPTPTPTTTTTTPTPPPPPTRSSPTSTTVVVEVVTVSPTDVSSGAKIYPPISWILLSCLVGSWIASVILVLV